LIDHKEGRRACGLGRLSTRRAWTMLGWPINEDSTLTSLSNSPDTTWTWTWTSIEITAYDAELVNAVEILLVKYKLEATRSTGTFDMVYAIIHSLIPERRLVTLAPTALGDSSLML